MLVAARNFLCLATLVVLGASALVMDPAYHHVERSVVTTAHRRHAANLNLLGRSPVPKNMAERRALRQKRCASRDHNVASSSAAAPTVNAEDNGNDNAPANVVQSPTTPADTTPTSVDSQPPASSSDSGNNGNGDGNGDSGGDPYSGDITYYATGLGACGITNNDSDFIAAVGWQFFDTYGGFSAGQNPNNAPICNKQVIIDYQGKSVQVTITDRCGGCQPEDLDLSPTAFSVLADQNLGRLHGATWRFV